MKKSLHLRAFLSKIDFLSHFEASFWTVENRLYPGAKEVQLKFEMISQILEDNICRALRQLLIERAEYHGSEDIQRVVEELFEKD